MSSEQDNNETQKSTGGKKSQKLSIGMLIIGIGSLLYSFFNGSEQQSDNGETTINKVQQLLEHGNDILQTKIKQQIKQSVKEALREYEMEKKVLCQKKYSHQ